MKKKMVVKAYRSSIPKSKSRTVHLIVSIELKTFVHKKILKKWNGTSCKCVFYTVRESLLLFYLYSIVQYKICSYNRKCIILCVCVCVYIYMCVCVCVCVCKRMCYRRFI